MKSLRQFALACFQEHLIENEVAVLRKVKHPNIIMLIEEVDTSSELYLVMELVKVALMLQQRGQGSIRASYFFVSCCSALTLVQGGDLFDAITSSAKYTERDASVMVYNLAGALKYLHSINIVHRDIKPENLLVFISARCASCLQMQRFGRRWLNMCLLFFRCSSIRTAPSR